MAHVPLSGHPGLLRSSTALPPAGTHAQPRHAASGSSREAGPASHPILLDPLADRPRDLATRQAIDRVLSLRSLRTQGRSIDRDCLYDFGATTSGNEVDLFLDRPYFESALVPAIMGARESIHIAMLAFEPGVLGGTVADALIAKKRQHPDMPIRVMLDTLGSSRNYLQLPALARHVARLREAGVEVVENPLWQEGLEHRKVVVIDSKEAFFGGACFGDDYYASRAWQEKYDRALNGNPEDVEAFLGECYGAGYLEAVSAPSIQDGKRVPGWKPPPRTERPEMRAPAFHDFGMRYRGPAVAHVQAGFLQSWLYQGRDLDPGSSDAEIRRRYFPDPPPPSADAKKGASVKIAHGIPGRDVMKKTLERVIDSAERTLDIEMAYAMEPDFFAALQRAARRGVRIRMIINGKDGVDIVFHWYGYRAMSRELAQMKGFRSWETHRYTHVKLMVADRRYVFASTGNPEPVSWGHAFDETALIDSRPLARSIERRVFAPDRRPSASREIPPDEAGGRTLWEKMWIGAAVPLWHLRERLVEGPRDCDTIVPPHLSPPASGSGRRPEANLSALPLAGQGPAA